MIIADFRREYGITADEIWDLPYREFFMLIAGLSEASVYRQAISTSPEPLDEAASAALIARL